MEGFDRFFHTCLRLPEKSSRLRLPQKQVGTSGFPNIGVLVVLLYQQTSRNSCTQYVSHTLQRHFLSHKCGFFAHVYGSFISCVPESCSSRAGICKHCASSVMRRANWFLRMAKSSMICTRWIQMVYMNKTGKKKLVRHLMYSVDDVDL